jgi:enoyl-CoA hydratase/carnithine racemase
MEIRVEEHGRHVAIITIDNQPRRNAMSRPMMAELVRVWEELERSSCRCIVLTGAGDKAFSAGADLSGDLSARQETARVVAHALLKQEAYSKPIVAANLCVAPPPDRHPHAARARFAAPVITISAATIARPAD